jgi:hypothetical protein
VKICSIGVEFEDTKGVIRIRISKTNRQHNGRKKKSKEKTNNNLQNIHINHRIWGGRVRDRIIVEVTTIYAITTKLVRSVHVHSEVYSIQHYVIKSVSG